MIRDMEMHMWIRDDSTPSEDRVQRRGLSLYHADNSPLAVGGGGRGIGLSFFSFFLFFGAILMVNVKSQESIDLWRHT